LRELEQPGTEDGRDREQERVARGGLTGEPHEETGGDRAARAGDAGDESERLCEAEGDGTARGELVERALACAALVGPPEDQAERRERERDEPQVAEGVRDRVLEREAENDDRHGPEGDEPGHARVGVVRAQAGVEVRPVVTTQGEPPRHADALDVAAEVQQDGGLGADLDHRREGGTRIPRADELAHDAQVRRGGDRQVLGQALDESEEDGLPQGHGRSRYPAAHGPSSPRQQRLAGVRAGSRDDDVGA
jgi:hypothetical protein